MEAVTVQIAKLELKPGDTLAVMVPNLLREEQREKVRQIIEPALPVGVKALVCDSGMTLQKISGDH